MERKTLEKFEGKKVRLILRNNFSYTDIIFYFSVDGLVQFEDRTGQKISLEPDFISMVAEAGVKDDD